MAYEGAIKETPNNPGLLKKGAVTLYNVAAAHIQRHEYLEALTHLEKAHELDPENTRIHIKLREVQRSVDKIREKHHRRKLMAE
jgi:tetratricopeptide (TPR) repeat protein